MRVAAKVDGEGLFLEDVLLAEGEQLPASCIEQRPPEGLHAPRWTGMEWVEGKPEAEIVGALKSAKIDHLHARAVDELANVLPEGRDELQAVHNATLIAICERLGIPVDARMSAVDAVQRKAFQNKADIERVRIGPNPEDAKTLEEARARLEVIQWN
jgi:hypothetical protein